MTELMQRRAVPVNRLEIGLRRRHLHIVMRGEVEGAAAADAEVDARRPDQRLHRRLDQSGLGRRRGNGEIFRQPFALCQVEDGEALQERDGLRFLAGLACPLLLVVGHEPVGIDDSGAVLAFADIAAERQRLAEGDPALDRETMLDHRPPEDQHIDPRIVSASGRVLRHGERRFRRRRPPRLDPGHAARLKLADDLGGDFVVEARPVGAGTGASGVSGHRGSPRRAPRASLPAFNPSRKPRPHSSSRGVAGCPRRRGRPRLQARPQGKAFPSQSDFAYNRGFVECEKTKRTIS